MDSTKMHIVFAADTAFVKPTCVAMASVIITNQDEDIVFHIVSQCLSKDDADTIVKAAAKFSKTATVQFHTIGDTIINQFPIRRYDHVTLATYYRLFLPALLPCGLAKALYIDGDVICAGLLKEFYDTDIADFSCAAVHDERDCDVECFKRLDYPMEKGYAAAGVLLVNLDWWRKNNVTQKMVSFITEHGDLCKWHDQDALNKVLAGTIKFAAIRYNVLAQAYNEKNSYGPYLIEEKEKAVMNPVLIHYSDCRKPWHAECYHPLKKVWRVLYRCVFGKSPRILNKYKGKTKLLWTIKRIIHALGIKCYKEFTVQHQYDTLLARLLEKFDKIPKQ